MLAVWLWLGGWLVAGLIVVGWFAWEIRKPAEPFVDPAIREDREVERLESWWSLPSFDPEARA